jgi:hypothetical protein
MADPTPVEEPKGSSEPVAEPVKEPEVVKPDWLDPRFNTVEDQAKAYKESEKLMTQKAQRASELERQLLERQFQPAPIAPKLPETEPTNENLDEQFWQKPTSVIDTIVRRRVSEVERKMEPLAEDRFERQKVKYANDPVFKELEPQIDHVFKLQPHLRNQEGSMDYVYKFLAAQNFNPQTERERIRQEIMAERAGANKITGSVEGVGSASDGPKATPKMDLSDEEQRTARKFYSDMPAQEAYKRYYDSRSKWEKRSA